MEMGGGVRKFSLHLGAFKLSFPLCILKQTNKLPYTFIKETYILTIPDAIFPSIIYQTHVEGDFYVCFMIWNYDLHNPNKVYQP